MGMDRLQSKEIHEEFMEFFILKKSEFLEGTRNSFVLKVVFLLFVLLIAKEAFNPEPNIVLTNILLPLAAAYVVVFGIYYALRLMNRNIKAKGFAAIALSALILLSATFALSF